MKKHMKIYYIVAIIGTIVDVFVIIYSNFVSELKYKYQLLWGSSSIVLLALIILSHLKKLKDKMVYYFVFLIMFICFVVSLLEYS